MTTKQTFSPRAGLILLLGVLVYSSSLNAANTRLWQLAGDKELSLGQTQGTMLTSTGQVVVGVEKTPIDLAPSALVFAVTRDKDGTLFIGAGYDGIIYRVDGNKAHPIAKTDLLVITTILNDHSGGLLVAGLPAGTIYRVNPAAPQTSAPQRAERFVTLPADVEAIWDMVQADDGTLYLGTGPEGKIYAVGKDGKPHLFADTEEEHILCLLINQQKQLLAGTAPHAQLLRLSAPGAVFALADFDGTELKKMALLPNGDVAVGVNKFSTIKKITKKASDTNSSAIKGAGITKPATGAPLTRGAFSVHRVTGHNGVQLLTENKKNYLAALAATPDGTILVGLGKGGTLLQINPDRTKMEAADLDERTISAIWTGNGKTVLGTTDAGAVYELNGVAQDANYLTPVLDAGAVARFGKLTYFGHQILKVVGRSGNTAVPDSNWTPWSKPLASAQTAKLTPASYAQFRITLAPNAQSRFDSLELYYTPANRRAIITSFNPDTPFKDTKTTDHTIPTSRRTIQTVTGKKNPHALKLTWSVDNPDNDQLRYQLFYRPLGRTLWLPVFKKDTIFTKTTYTFDTTNVPSGLVQFRLVADDAPANPDGVMSDERISVPVLIDNHPPLIKKLQFKGGAITGTVVDEFSQIAGIEWALDQAPFFPVACTDGIFDSRLESFRFTPPLFDAGPHVITIRAIDRNQNQTTREIQIEISR